MLRLSRQLPLSYQYDGSFEGFLCCVFASFSAHGRPAAIVAEGEEEQQGFLPVFRIETDREQAARVYRSIPQKISPQALVFVEHAFRSCLDGKELLLLDFLDQGYDCGARVLHRLTDDTVHALTAAVRSYNNEAEQYRQFLRFSDYQGVLVAQMEPKNDVLVDLAPHFTARFPRESFLIYDVKRKKALVARPGKWTVVVLEDFVLAAVSQEEARIQTLWKLFYDTIAIESRINERCRMSHMPKRFWKYMTEFHPSPVAEEHPTTDKESLLLKNR